ncbi:MAG: hypothetical protein V1921_06560 [Candidatus Altiarchaeota archaeon]
MTGTKIIKLKLEEGGAERLPKLLGDRVHDALRIYDKNWGQVIAVDEWYRNMLADSESLDMRSDELQSLQAELEKKSGRLSGDQLRWHNMQSGILLSALMQNSSETEFTLKTNKPWLHLGFGLKDGKKVTVIGSLGTFAGNQLAGGALHVRGNTGSNTGERMKAGSIKIEGNTKDYLGSGMEGGTIEVSGNAGKRVGSSLKDGKIEVVGDVGDEAAYWTHGGTIHVKGNAGKNTGWNNHSKLIVDGKIEGFASNAKDIWKGTRKIR